MIHSPLFDSIQKYLKEYDVEGKTMFLFVPYIKTNVLEELIDGIEGSKVIITTWNPNDIQSGSSELELYPFCKERNIALYISTKLHLKIYSIGLESAILATGNISLNGLMQGGNHEAAVMLENLTSNDRIFFEKIRNESRLVDDVMYEELVAWRDDNEIIIPEDTVLEDIITARTEDYFLTSALPMTYSIDDLIVGYDRISSNEEPSDDPEITACVFHDLANYGIIPGLSKDEFIRVLADRFFTHPFIQKIDEFISPETYFGRIKEWIQNNCTDVPVPSRRELTGNVQVLLEWFERLGGGKYVIDVPGARSQRIRKLDDF